MSAGHITPASDLPDPWRRYQLAHLTSRSVLASGLPGTGKSYLPNTCTDHLAGPGTLDLADVFNLTCHEDMGPGDVLGTWLPKAGKWDFRPGPGLIAWRLSWERPVRVVLNELDQAAGPILTQLYSLMDDVKSAKITLPITDEDGQPVTVRPHPVNFQVVSTMNGAVEDLPLALQERHAAKVQLDSPHPDSLVTLPSCWQETANGLTSATARLEGRGTSPREWHHLHALTDAGCSLADAAALVWPEDRAREVADHLLIAGADPAGRIRPAKKVAKTATVAPAARAAAGVQATAEDGPFTCPAGHVFGPGPDGDGNIYPDASGTVWCDECGDFGDAAECASRTNGECE